MGFNKRKMEDRRRKAAEQEAAARRALGPQLIEDSVKLVEAWNQRVARGRPNARPATLSLFLLVPKEMKEPQAVCWPPGALL
jgi:hypothetical protein